MDILSIGGVFPKEDELSIFNKSKGVVQHAANAVQWNIIKGLDKCNEKPITILNSMFIGSYPKFYSDIYVKSAVWSHTEGAKDRNVGFLNLFGIKQIWRMFAISNQIKEWANRRDGHKKVIIVYSMHTPFIYAAQKAKKINPDIHICLICPDLPEYITVDRKSGSFTKFLIAVDSKQMDRLLPVVDSFVFLTKHMAEHVNVGNRPWIVMEGIVDPGDKPDQIQPSRNDDKKVVLYTGTLNKSFGIMELLKAFTMIDDPAIHLWICGAGEAQPEVEQLAKMDVRVTYFGQVNRDSAVELQREADLLINPRDSKGEFTKCSFPSKLMEYMVSGTPSLIYKLDGIPNEYYQYLFIIEGDGPEGIALSIRKVFSKSKDEVKILGEKARNFVITHKNHIIQSQRIIDLTKK